MDSPFRALYRLTLYFCWTVFLIPAQFVCVMFKLPLAVSLPVFYHRVCARIIGIEVRRAGAMSRVRPTLFVSNHSSYLDVTVLGALIGGAFVAKSEVAGWPGFGVLAKLQRSVFVDRRARFVATQREQMRQRLDDGENLILFAEGTSSDGNRVLPFKSALLSVAEIEVRGRPITVQPVSVAYTHLDGMPLGRHLRPFYTWYGDMDLASHLWHMIGMGKVTVAVEFHPPVTISEFGSRKALSQHCHEEVALGVASAISGRRQERRPAEAA